VTDPATPKHLLPLAGLQALIETLAASGYQVLGPTLREGAIVYDEITSLADLPAGWTDHQEPGRYRLERREDAALFGYAVGPQSWKRFLHPPTETLWRAHRTADGVTFEEPAALPAKFAFLGVRACELHAIAIQDKVLRDGPYPDSPYQSRRAQNFTIAVNCGTAGGTCFCASMATGPAATAGYDLALTELLGGTQHEFLIESGTPEGAKILATLPHTPAPPEAIAQAEAVIANTTAHMGRTLDTTGLKERLQANLTDPHWDEVAQRCLSCGNCTMVCPTCFCTTLEDHTDLATQTAERTRRWDSCFSLDFSYIHGDSVRSGVSSRYRQWLTHKLANWIDQFGTSGCVGCGRCVTWCPVGIDITEEAAAIGRAEDEHGKP
jgi:formate hydrogenlyase subunit 6/NADH:ubiquinone oxidoreductase subunit I